LTIDDYYDLFKAIKGIDLARIIRTALEFRGRADRPEYGEIGRKAEEALKRIAVESRLNRERVRRFGVKLDEYGKTFLAGTSHKFVMSAAPSLQIASADHTFASAPAADPQELERPAPSLRA
jgi:hypothetical protein